ncbi:MAG: CBS domain-containing protein [Bacteroidetes bacterium]|jgi:CBS domain-containing protein|nr:CBS domain-containing protein [Bacteroidota bacterium]
MDYNAAVATIMTKEPRTVLPDSPATELDTLFKENRIHHVPVVDEEHKVVGIVGKSDFLYLLRGYTVHESDRFREAAKLRAFKAEEIMYKEEVETLQEDQPIKEAVRLLSENRYQALPIVDHRGKLTGILTTHDIIDIVHGEAQAES